MFSRPGDLAIRYVMKPLIKRLDQPARADALRPAFASAESLQGLSFALVVFRTSLGTRTRRQSGQLPGRHSSIESFAKNWRGCSAKDFGRRLPMEELLAGVGLVENLSSGSSWEAKRR